jgi:hypothetical protein
MGHANAQMLFRVYAKWIDGADKSREREKLNVGFRHDSATARPHFSENQAESIYLRGAQRDSTQLSAGRE